MMAASASNGSGVGCWLVGWGVGVRVGTIVGGGDSHRLARVGCWVGLAVGGGVAVGSLGISVVMSSPAFSPVTMMNVAAMTMAPSVRHRKTVIVMASAVRVNGGVGMGSPPLFTQPDALRNIAKQVDRLVASAAA